MPISSLLATRAPPASPVPHLTSTFLSGSRVQINLSESPGRHACRLVVCTVIDRNFLGYVVFLWFRNNIILLKSNQFYYEKYSKIKKTINYNNNSFKIISNLTHFQKLFMIDIYINNFNKKGSYISWNPRISGIERELNTDQRMSGNVRGNLEESGNFR